MSTKKHILVCVQNRPAGHPRSSCQAKGSPSIYQAFVDEFDKRAIWDSCRLSNTGCLGPCDDGASVVVYPEGVFYGHVKTSDVHEIIETHLVGGQVVDRLALGHW